MSTKIDKEKNHIMKAIKIIVIILSLFILVAVGAIFYLTRGLDKVGSTVINDIDMQNVEDGIYVGKFDMGRWANELTVTVNNGRVEEIDINKTVVFEREEVTKKIIDCVIENQNLKIDVVSGATVTSKAYLKSIENALTK